MMKRILLTGATDGIGLATANMLVSLGHQVLLHGRSADKLDNVVQSLRATFEDAQVESYLADLSQISEVESLAKGVSAKHDTLDVLINNAGVFSASNPKTPEGLDVRFAVNTIAPYLLTQRLLPRIGKSGRVINLSSAAQSPVDAGALIGQCRLPDGAAYAQSKLALTMWSRHLALSLGDEGPAIIAVNPGSMLGSKMVKEAYGVGGKDIQIGAEILTRAATSDEFASASGQYFDNDLGRFAPPHPDALDDEKCQEIVDTIESVLAEIQNPKQTES
ncbi:SDR family NAD(P)-dependent oxidoreductase [Novipirellula sp. SH528]|uniref:SDR family NAD(P)-dependent oxidoreductase n=1 Tax=Novipirellula sp. SH528 TaxID=3454466 RepID=UPI003FA0845D